MRSLGCASAAGLQTANEESNRIVAEAWARLDTRSAALGCASATDVQAANEESNRIVAEAWRRLDVRTAAC